MKSMPAFTHGFNTQCLYVLDRYICRVNKSHGNAQEVFPPIRNIIMLAQPNCMKAKKAKVKLL